MKYTSLPYHFLRRGALTLVLSLIVASSFSAQVGIKTTLGKNQILVGDPLALQIEVNMPPAGVAVQLPEVAIADTANNVEVLRQTDWDTTRSDRSLLLRKEIILTAWDSGYVEIPG